MYIVYNSVGEYAYQLLFSNQKLDRIRFDSMDKKWNVESKPNHFHPRFTIEGYKSPMKGKVEIDIALLVSLIKSGKLKKSNIRF